MNTKVLEKVFGKQIATSEEIYKGIFKEVSEKKSEYMIFLTPGEFVKIGLEKGAAWINEYLTNETIQRVYLANVTGYFRMIKWIQGIEVGMEKENYLVFSASARGFLEATTDYYDAMENILLTIAENFNLMKSALNGKVDDRIVSYGELENILLHFQEANKNNGKNDPMLKPKSAKAYMESDNLKHLNLYECYGELCETTHPAKSSLDFFIDDMNSVYSIDLSKDSEMIEEFLSKYADKFSELLERCENLIIISLQLLNRFGIDKYSIKFLSQVDTSKVKVWNKINQYIA